MENKLKIYKLTKPDVFSTTFKECYNELLESLVKPKKQLPKQWQQNVTDYFNYGFNEHSLQIYVHKITQLSEAYRQQRQQYVEKCEQGSCALFDRTKYALFDRANEMRKLSKEVFPIDLGGLFIPVDDKLIDIDIP